LKGSRESQNVSVSSNLNAALLRDTWKNMSQVGSCARGRMEDGGVCIVKRVGWEDWQVSLTVGRRSD
jgi:hypothetical protein